jgi:hypothetical protein
MCDSLCYTNSAHIFLSCAIAHVNATGVIAELTQWCWYVLCSTRKETCNSDRRIWFSYILFIIIIGILVLFIYIYNKTSIKRNILTVQQNTWVSRSGWGIISTPVCILLVQFLHHGTLHPQETQEKWCVTAVVTGNCRVVVSDFIGHLYIGQIWCRLNSLIQCFTLWTAGFS